jgi:hypothetical protein
MVDRRRPISWRRKALWRSEGDSTTKFRSQPTAMARRFFVPEGVWPWRPKVKHLVQVDETGIRPERRVK